MAAEESLEDYDPAIPLHRGRDCYRYAPEELGDGVAVETSLERAMRLRREFLDALKECGGTAAREPSLFTGEDLERVRARWRLCRNKIDCPHLACVSFCCAEARVHTSSWLVNPSSSEARRA